jgi:hypothetical protein
VPPGTCSSPPDVTEARLAAQRPTSDAASTGVYDWDVVKVRPTTRACSRRAGMTPGRPRRLAPAHPSDDLAEFDRRLVEHFRAAAAPSATTASARSTAPGAGRAAACDPRRAGVRCAWSLDRRHHALKRATGAAGKPGALHPRHAGGDRWHLRWNLRRSLYLSDRAKDFGRSKTCVHAGNLEPAHSRRGFRGLRAIRAYFRRKPA